MHPKPIYIMQISKKTTKKQQFFISAAFQFFGMVVVIVTHLFIRIMFAQKKTNHCGHCPLSCLTFIFLCLKYFTGNSLGIYIYILSSACVCNCIVYVYVLSYVTAKNELIVRIDRLMQTYS